MNFKILFVCFVVTLHRVHCKESRVVSICNDEDEISSSGRNLNTGSNGRRGEKGDRGIPGKAGPFGLQGPPGTKGNQGVRGPPGIDGAAGIQGPPGTKGNQGVNGTPGINGAAGIQGPPGEKGIQGIRGPPGIDGAAGIQGPPGMKGNQGVKGESGSTDGIAAFQQEMRNLMTDFNHSISLLESKLKAANRRIDDLDPPVNCTQSNKNGSQVNSAHLTQPVNCSQSDKNGSQLLSSGERVYCHQQWRVIQRRFNGQVIFHMKAWNEHKNGFGSLSTEFWIGLDKIYHLTKSGRCRLRIELGAFDGSEAYAEYRDFSIGSESDLFRLHISGYNGTAGDAIMRSGHSNNNMAFTTIDRDNDGWSKNCAGYRGGVMGAWWWNSCGNARLNGRWKENLNTLESFIWWDWKRSITLKSSMMMIRCN